MSDVGWCPFAERILGVTSFSDQPLDPAGFCDHAAGGFLSTMRRPDFWNNAGTSVHFAIGREGSIIQLVNLFKQAWAEGRDARGQSVGPTSPGVTWPPFDGRNPNGLLISTEHEDAETVNGQTHFITSSEWTEAQYQADLRVKRWCVEEVKRVTGADLMRFGIDSLAGHHMFDPVNRKECPGAYWRNEGRNRLWDDLGGVPDVADVKNGWVHEAPFWCFYNDGFCGERRGSTDGKFPFRISKAFGDPADGGAWWWLRKGGARISSGAPVSSDAYWTKEEGD